MASIDMLIASALSNEIKKRLSHSELRKIEHQLFQTYGISIRQAIGQYPKLYQIITSCVQYNADRILQECLTKVYHLENTDSKFHMTIKDQKLASMLIDMIWDKDCREVLQQVMYEPMTISEILSSCNLAKTSGYRKINLMIRNGVLVSYETTKAADGRKIEKYRAVFDEAVIQMGQVTKVKLSIPRIFWESSSIFQTKA